MEFAESNIPNFEKLLFPSPINYAFVVTNREEIQIQIYLY